MIAVARGMPVDLELSGKYAVVTGGGRGIGRGIVLALAQAGMHVAFSYLRRREAAQATLEEIRRYDPLAFASRANVADPEALRAFVDEVKERFGQVHLLVHNAASGVERPALEFTRHHFDWTMGINAWGLLALVQAARPLMGSGASVVAISSLGSVRALPYYTLVGASKGALESLARHLARELGPSGIRVNVVSAGAVDTDALRHFPNREEMLDETVRRTPLGRLTTPEDVAGAVLFLASNLSRMVTGATVYVDGGYHAMG
jgi:enoyl-[acyl-carrier protein] reductase III